MKSYDVVVIGAGHAGCEAAFAAARLGASTLLITLNMDHIAQMSCNPAIGGVGKGQVVREIDACGGAQGFITDAAAIQFRLLNRGKGPAVRSPRAQCDKVCYQRGMKFLLEITPNLDILQSEAVDFEVDEKRHRITAVKTQFGISIPCRSVVLSSGTFLRGKLHFGLQDFPGGRVGDAAASAMSCALENTLKLRLGRLKTGTPSRILQKTIDFSNMDLQPAEAQGDHFSYWGELNRSLPLMRTQQREMPCYMVYTNKKTAEIVRENLQQAPLYQGKIEGIGARYCPSFEDKVVRFAHHERHLLFLEPEGEFTGEYYINGFSTSLPPKIQELMIKTLPGFEHAVISRYAYAIEYDFVFPDQTERTLRSRFWENFFTAGQINGTSGYEEAAGQGLVAGFNAARIAAGKEPLEFPRDKSYIGVMIDDLISKEIVEPYRLFTSRAEYRLHLRQDNADLRLCDFAYEHGLLPENKYRSFARYRDLCRQTLQTARTVKHKGKSLLYWFKSYAGEFDPDLPLPCPAEALAFLDHQAERERVLQQLAINAHYDGYLEREDDSIKRLQKLEAWKIPADFDYAAIPGLRNESRSKLIKAAPSTLAQASRLDGVTPSEIGLLQIHLTRLKHQQAADKQ
ncbi:MAG: tRNA uridine-5-carboxymethylaminomethyl(34) synthesis enzyme MnmG [Lentisphaerae bacterium]|nr:tRNA uridine-5-carboxymethylaminomethyl(34) synthesis enzyme MnmG [Lentisphaerota bacterium]